MATLFIISTSLVIANKQKYTGNVESNEEVSGIEQAYEDKKEEFEGLFDFIFPKNNPVRTDLKIETTKAGDNKENSESNNSSTSNSGGTSSTSGSNQQAQTTPSSTLTPVPTLIPSPIPTHSVTPTMTPAPTVTPTPRPTNSPTPIPTVSPKPDLIITKVSIPFPPFMKATWNFIEIEIKNQGNAKYFNLSNVEGNITASNGGTSFCEVGLPHIDPGLTETTSFHCIVYESGYASAEIKVDANNTVPESNESNNSYSFRFYVYE